jgi:hypothetical protein
MNEFLKNFACHPAPPPCPIFNWLAYHHVDQDHHPRHETNLPPRSSPHPTKCRAQTLFHVLLFLVILTTDAADAESPLKESELQVLRSQFFKEQEAGHITVQTKFNYAWGLIKAEKHDNQVEGVKLLTGTCFVNSNEKYIKRHQDGDGSVFIIWLWDSTSWVTTMRRGGIMIYYLIRSHGICRRCR